MAKVVLAVFDRLDDAQRVIGRLRESGFDPREISLIVRDAASSARPNLTAEAADTGEAAAVGASTGAIVGAGAGFLAALALPAIGPALAAGWIVSTLLGAGIGAAAGGLIGVLVDLGVPQEEARHYHEALRRGGVVLAVRTNDVLSDRAAEIMDDGGAIDIRQRAEFWRRMSAVPDVVASPADAASDDVDAAARTSAADDVSAAAQRAASGPVSPSFTPAAPDAPGLSHVPPPAQPDLEPQTPPAPAGSRQAARVYRYTSQPADDPSFAAEPQHAPDQPWPHVPQRSR